MFNATGQFKNDALRISALLYCALVLLVCNVAGAVEIETSVEPTEIYLGEAVTLTVRVSGYQDGMENDLSRLSASAITFLGQSDQQFQNITIINGRRQVSGFSGRIFQYRVVPANVGSHNLGPIGITQSGKTISTVPGASIKVRPIPQQDTVLLFLESSKPQVILDEPFSINLRILVRRLDPPYADQSPLPANAPPFLSIPYLDRDEIEGLERENTEQLLNTMLVTDGESFRINNFSVGNDPFGGVFGRQQQARFRLNRQSILYEEQPYFEYTFSLQCTPQREGVYHFGPVVFKGPTFVKVTPHGEGLTETIYAVADVVTVNAVPPPAEGRPPTYIGAIGSNLTVNASLDAQTCYIGDPLTLTLEIGGDVRLANITAPRLGIQKGLLKDFRLYEDTVQRESTPDLWRYRFTIRPSKAGTIEFPPVAVSYYDTLKSAYCTVYTEPIPVRANAITEVKSDIIIETGPQRMTISANGESDISRLSPAPIAINGHLSSVETFFIPRVHIPLLLTGPLLWCAMLLLRLWRRLLPTLRRLRLRRSAATIAYHQIRQYDTAKKTSANTGRAEFQLSQALRGYLLALYGEKVKAATPDECESILQNAGISAELAQRYSRCLESCTSAAFAGQTLANKQASSANLAGEAETLIRELETAWQQKGRRTKLRLPNVYPLMLSFFAFASLLRANIVIPYADFESQRAMTALLSAANPERFAQAVDALAELIEQGAANGTLFFNYGTALLMAGDPTAAIEALSRAERYDGTTWSIRRNMQLARRALNEDAPPTLPWYRILFFWHFRLPTSVRITVASCAFLMIWIAAFLLKTRIRNAAVVILWIAISGCILFGASAVNSLEAESHAILVHTQRLPRAGGTPEDQE